MSMQEVFAAYDLTLPNTVTGAAVRITQLTDPHPKAGARPIVETVSGSPYASFTGVGEQNPDFTFATKDLATLLSVFVAAYNTSATTGYLLASFTGNGDVGYQKMLAGSTRAAPSTSVHRVHRFLNPLLYLQGISASQDGDASARVRLCPQWDGTNPPRSVLNSQTLTSTTPAVNSIFTLGPVKLNGSFITGLQSTEVNFDLGFQEMRAGGQVFPTFLFAEKLITTVSLTTRTAGYLDNLVTSISSLAIYFRQRKPNDAAAVYGDNESKHIKITASAGAMISDAMTAGLANAPLTLNISGGISIAVDQTIT